MQNSIEIVRPRLTSYQKKMLYGDERFTITEAATKIGKTFSHLWWLFEEAMKSERQGANYWWCAPVYNQAEIAFNRLRRVVREYGIFEVNISKLTISCPNGAIIHFKSAEKPDNLFGEDVYAAVFDEFTRAREEAWFALRSTLTKTKGKCKLIGNAKGKKNWGYLLGAKARAGEPNYAYHRITAYDAVNEGILSIEEIEQAKRDLPEVVFKELYLAEPQEDGTNPFGFEHIRFAVKPLANTQPVYFGIDLAKRQDWTVITGLDSMGDISFFERFQMDWSQTKRRVIELLGRNVYACIDSTGVGDPIVEDIQKQIGGHNIVGYNYSGGTKKQQLMEGLAVAIQQARVSVLSGIMQDELEAFEFTFSPSGVKYSAPAGFTDDCVNSLALANNCMQQFSSHNFKRRVFARGNKFERND
jgi:phage FluMu gp28-like protein